SELELKAVAEEVIAQVERAYWDLYLADQERAIQQQSLALAGTQLAESTERVAVGRLPELELAAVRAEVATRREAMIDAESRYEQARLSFLYLLNPPGESPWDMVPVPGDRPFAPASELDPVAVHEALAMQYRADLGQARLDLRKGVLELARTRSGLLPRLDVFITLGRTTYAQSFGESTPDPGSPFYNVTAGATFELPVTDRQARARHARARYGRDQLELALENMGRLVQRDVRAAYVEVGRARQQIEATRVARDLQEQKVQAEQEKFRVGRSTNLLVLQAQRDLIASQLAEARSMVTYLESLVDLHLMEGTLLERRGIEPPGAGVE
ncbi:MAG: TolC family protein, partial [Gemmatimonadota bacterium]